MAIEVIAELKSSKPTLAIPKGAIVEDRTGVWVFVKINPETFEPRKVRVNRYIDGYAEITDGVNLGEVIVVDGAYLLNQAR
jgi:Cu(I)/Ag(I) efflux system membrane fusion protein